MQTLFAYDLTCISGADELWRPRRSAEQRLGKHLSLTPEGFASPLGFWIAAAESSETVVTRG